LAHTAQQRYWWRISLELKLRQSHGDAFQELFCSVMTKVHGSDFVRTRPFGQLGDKGCDGFLQSSGRVYQCYGALGGGGEGKVAYLISKMDEDYEKAKKKLAEIMKEWHMAHNFVGGLPIEAVAKMEELRGNNTNHKFGFISMEGLEQLIFALDTDSIEDMLGMAANAQDFQNLQAAELRQLIASVASATDAAQTSSVPIRPVPVDKLEFNKLPGHWRALISGGWQNSHHVSEYLNHHPDPLTGERVAGVFRDRYSYLRAQNLHPGATMLTLYEDLVGIGRVPAERQVAAQAILAFMFESCDIFEDQPSKVNGDPTS
jgi:hypothetical protein